MANPDNIKDHKWKPGQSGNPKGRPKKTIPELDELLEKWAGGETPEDAEINHVAKKLVEKAKGGDIEAIKFLFERVYGKVTNPIDIKSGGNAINAPVINVLPARPEPEAE